MKILLTLFILLFSSSVVAGEIPHKLFGIQLFDHISNYANINSGKFYDFIPDLITYDDEDINNIIKTPIFDSYYLRTNSNYIIHNITGSKSYLTNINEFQNQCLKDKSDLLDELSVFFGIKKNDFKLNYYEDAQNQGIFIDSSFNYKDDNIEFQFAVYCGYFSDNNNIVSVLFCSLVTYEYFINYVDKRWKKIDAFDNKFIQSYVEKFISS